MTTPLELWHRELAAGVDGQQPGKPATWKRDALHRAACWWAAGNDALTEAARERCQERAWEVLATELEEVPDAA